MTHLKRTPYMDDISYNIHRYSDHVLLEVIIDGGNGNVTARSVKFDFLDADRGRVAHRGELPTSYEEEIRSRVENAGYAIVDRQVA